MKAEENALLTEVGPDKPAGRMFRRYWLPIALSDEVPTPDCDPISRMLLGERFVVFRDTEGKVGALADRCMHRGVTLSVGRVEECGIRCIYHGWKFDREGNILETPNHPADTYRKSKKARALKVREQSGIIWVYMGPADKEPPFRAYAFDEVPEENRLVFRTNVKSTYLSMWEGGVDSSHVGVLHTNEIRPNWLRKRKGEEVVPGLWDGLSPTYEVQDMDYGFRYVAFRHIPGSADRRQARMVPAIMPFVRDLPGVDFDLVILEVPTSDDSVSTYTITFSKDQKLDREEMKKFLGLVAPHYDDASHNVLMSWPDNLMQNRASMNESWSGYDGIKPEDLAMALSLGGDWDRTSENLVAADIAVMRLRQTIRKSIEANESGGDPIGLFVQDMRPIRSTDKEIGADEDWTKL